MRNYVWYERQQPCLVITLFISRQAMETIKLLAYPQHFFKKKKNTKQYICLTRYKKYNRTTKRRHLYRIEPSDIAIAITTISDVTSTVDTSITRQSLGDDFPGTGHRLLNSAENKTSLFLKVENISETRNTFYNQLTPPTKKSKPTGYQVRVRCDPDVADEVPKQRQSQPRNQ